jgi:polyferredoxin
MMASMFVSTVIYLYFPAYATILELVILNMMAMAIVLVPILLGLMGGDRPLEKAEKDGKVGRFTTRSILTSIIIALTLLSEVFMGWTFAILGGAVSTAGGVTGILAAVIGSSSSYWFIFTMSSEMAITFYFIRKTLPKGFSRIVAAQTLIMVLSPTAIADHLWAAFSLVAGSAVMIVLFIYLFEFLYKNRVLSSGFLNYMLLLMFAYALMMAGQFLWLLYGNAAVFVLSVFVEMVVYFRIVLDDRALTSSPPKRWQTAAFWVFGFLGLLFIAEFFMGGVLDIQVNGAGYFTGMMLASTAGSFPYALAAGLFNFITFFMSITMSPWFLIMMGIEMGALVAFKIRYTRDLETKIRLALLIFAYAVYSILLPNFLIPSQAIRQIPWIGWGMGVGSSGALAPTVVLALLGTYVISGSLSLLFGSRQLCSVMCMAPLMYQGTTIDAMSTFNRTSRLGRKLLRSKISSAYKVVVSAVWVSLMIAAVLSYLTSTGILNVSIFGMDLAFFLFMFYFSFLWYILWIMIPFVGTYGCATTGMCGWGAFNQLVSRSGFFRLKVKDKQLCVSCSTKDCARVCPLGLIDMPEKFEAKGEFRSYKCIGDGNCISACPYQNIGFYDIRHWIREKTQRPGSVGQHAPNKNG